MTSPTPTPWTWRASSSTPSSRQPSLLTNTLNLDQDLEFLAQFGSGSRVMLSILKEKFKNNFGEKTVFLRKKVTVRNVSWVPEWSSILHLLPLIYPIFRLIILGNRPGCACSGPVDGGWEIYPHPVHNNIPATGQLSLLIRNSCPPDPGQTGICLHLVQVIFVAQPCPSILLKFEQCFV